MRGSLESEDPAEINAKAETLQTAFGRQDLRTDLAAAMEDPAVLADPGNERILDVLQHPERIGGALNEDSSFLNTADPPKGVPNGTPFA